MTPASRRAAVLGSPIAHSLSPALHRAAYAALDLDWQYDAIDVTSSDLPRFLAGLGPEWIGLSLTMPLKTAVVPLLAGRSATVTGTGAANTVLLDVTAVPMSVAERRVPYGDNTDVAGMLAAIEEYAPNRELPRHATLLGAGATARSALVALARVGVVQVLVVARQPERAADLVEFGTSLGCAMRAQGWDSAELGPQDCALVISTTPAGSTDDLATVLPADVGVLLDVVYSPWPTVLASAWRQRAGIVVPGAAMLLHQAAAQVILMTGSPAPLAAMRSALPPELLA